MKRKREHPKIMKEFVVWSVLPFLSPEDTASMSTVNHEMHRTLNIDRVWKQQAPRYKAYPKEIIRKTVHFERLAQRMTGAELLQEVTRREQWRAIEAFLSTKRHGGVLRKHLMRACLEHVPFPEALQRGWRWTCAAFDNPEFLRNLKRVTFMKLADTTFVDI